MGDKVDYQHGGTSDGSTFKSTPKVPSTQTGDFADQERLQPGSVPGAAQELPPLFNPARAS